MECVILTLSGIVWMLLISKTECAPSERQPRQSPFSRMAGGSGGGPFHSPMGGPMGGNHMPPSMGGPSMGGQSQGQAGNMMHPLESGCIRGNIVCPQWCLVEDSQGCKTCPCGPGGGMTGLVGGPSSGPMGGAIGGPMAMAAGHMGGGSGSIVGGTTVGGGVDTGSGHHSATSSGTVSYSSTSNTQTSSHISTTRPQTQVTTKPVKECAATLLCATTCKEYSLGGVTSSGCKSCSCPSSHHVSSTTVNYIIQTVQPPKKECTVTSHCMRTCPNGYVMSKTDSYGCPECSCLLVEKPYKYPVEIAIEPPEYTKPVYSSHVQTTYTLTCHAHSCNSGCTVGYKCGTDGCPTCECIHPTGLSSLTQSYVQKPLTCQNTLACPSSCSLGYKCGIDGCPTCECLYATTSYTQVRPQYTAQTCTHTLTCAATCTHGYELFTDGTSSCYKCACKQPPVVYAVQRPKPQYQIVQCPSTTSCATECPQGYTVIQTEGSCPKCQCKQASVHYAVLTSGSGCTDNCHQTSYYTSSGSHNTASYSGGISYIVGSNSLSGVGTSHVIDGSTSMGSYVTAGGGVASDSYRTSGVTGYGTFSGAAYCPPLPPDCQPSCIKYDDPHCRKCICNTSYVRYTHG